MQSQNTHAERHIAKYSAKPNQKKKKEKTTKKENSEERKREKKKKNIKAEFTSKSSLGRVCGQWLLLFPSIRKNQTKEINREEKKKKFMVR